MIIKPQQLLLQRRETHKYGLGVYALQDIPPLTVIASFDGPLRTAKSINDLPTIDDNEDDGFCIRHAVQCGPDKWRDGTENGIARYLAHSCNPNCGIFGLFTLVTRRQILYGEELTWDYITAELDNHVLKAMKCECESGVLCRGKIGSFALLSSEERCEFIIRNTGFISAWLVIKYNLY